MNNHKKYFSSKKTLCEEAIEIFKHEDVIGNWIRNFMVLVTNMGDLLQPHLCRSTLYLIFLANSSETNKPLVKKAFETLVVCCEPRNLIEPIRGMIDTLSKDILPIETCFYINASLSKLSITSRTNPQQDREGRLC